VTLPTLEDVSLQTPHFKSLHVHGRRFKRNTEKELNEIFKLVLNSFRFSFKSHRHEAASASATSAVFVYLICQSTLSSA
jgi:hypothetical protein